MECERTIYTQKRGVTNVSGMKVKGERIGDILREEVTGEKRWEH